MVEEPRPLTRRSTGVPGLDPLLEGGLLEGGVYVVLGTPGAGKTILGNQVCFGVARRGANAAYITLLAEAHDRMLAHMRRMRFFDPALVGGQISYLSGFKVLEGGGLAALSKLIRGIITDRRAEVLVIDGLVSAEDAAPSDRDFNKFIHELQVVASLMGTTVILLSSSHRREPFQPEHTMVDGIIELTDHLTDLRTIRRLRVRKLRGSHPVTGQHTMEISDDGIQVLPRLETRSVAIIEPPPGLRARFGVPRLDRMMCDGLPSGSVTSLLGPSGCGKTILGLQFLHEGARQGESGLYFGFYERPGALIAKGERIGLGLLEDVNRGHLQFVWQPPTEAVIDVLGHRLLAAVHQHRVKRLVLDGVQGFQLAAEFPRRVRTMFSALSEELEAAGVTTVYTMETRDLFGPRIEAPVEGLSPITQNILLFRHVELRSQLYRLISILKMRDSDHDSSLCQLRITERGLDVGPPFDADQILSGTARPAARRAPPTPGSRGRKKPRRRP
jgi:circadian clock protein KaiC